MPRSTLARLVRARREHLHLTQVDLARRVGVSRSEISEIEAGRVKHPRAGIFARLGQVLGLPGAALLAAVGYAASEVLGAPGAAELEDTEELAVLASMLVGMTGSERAWLRERLRETQELVLLRRGRGRSSVASPPGTGRTARRRT